MACKFTYIEVIISAVLLSIVILPLLPALGQAQANHRYALHSRQAQGIAAYMALEVRDAADSASAQSIVNQAAARTPYFVYRITLAGAYGQSSVVAGNTESPLPPPTASFSGGLTEGAILIVAEVFNSEAVLIGVSVAVAL